jgi:hypothetical protein
MRERNNLEELGNIKMFLKKMSYKDVDWFDESQGREK